MFSVGDDILGKYRVISQLNPGQFGSVFVVANYAMNRTSVLKAVECENTADIKELIEAYSQNCEHPNIARIFAAELLDVATPQGKKTHVFMEQEYLTEGSLQSALSSGYMSAWHASSYLKSTLHALEYLHASAIYHGDVKPDNIMVSGDSIKLIDFGLAQNLNFVGAPRARDAIYRTHAAPEIDGQPNLSEGSDVYAAGITYFRLLNQIVDWHGLVTGLSNWKSLRDSGRLLSKIGFRQEVPDCLRRISRKACHPNPRQRYSSAAEFRRAVDRVTFEHRWREIAPGAWESRVGEQFCQADISAKRTGYSLSIRRNGRRIKPDRTFTDRRSAEQALIVYLSESTAFRT